MKSKISALFACTLVLCACISALTACKEKEPPHTHSYTTLTFDGESHWFECECEEKNNVVSHNIKNGECACGYVVPHSHEYATLKTDEAQHWYECVCGDKSGVENHIPSAENQKCTVCNYMMSGSTTDEDRTPTNPEITFATLTANGEEVFGNVSNSVTQYNFNNEITVPDGCIVVVVPLHSNISNGVANKTIDLQIGNNTCHLYLMVGDAVKKTYTVTIRRLPMYTVNFVTGNGEALTSQTIEEGSCAAHPNDLEKAGYTFNGWNFDFSTPITSNVTVSASWSANTNTPYVVEYYLENLEDDNYTLTESIHKTGTTDTLAYADIQTFTGFTAERTTVSGNINADGKQVLKVYYQRNEYSVANYNTNCGSIMGAGTYKYGTSVTLVVTQTNLGYEFLGWYSGETLLISDSECIIAVGENITPKFGVVPEMLNFYFVASSTTCEITGITDRTVTEIIVPNYVTSIGYNAFSGCTNLASVVIPDSVTSIGNYAFYSGIIIYCKAQSKPSGWNTYWHGYGPAIWACDNNDIASDGYIYIFADGIIYGIKSGVATVVGAEHCKNIVTANIPSFITYKGNSYNITSIKEYAFSDCVNLVSIEIPNDVTNIGQDAFYWCGSLVSVVIGSNVTSIGDEAFYYCYKLVEVINNSPYITVEKGSYNNGSVGAFALSVSNCDDNYISKVRMDSDGYITYNDGSDIILLGYHGNETNLILPSNITKIYDYLFSYYNGQMPVNLHDKITSVVIPNGVTSIGRCAFYGCSSLANIEIPDSVISIGYSAFYACNNLTSITIPDSVKSIGDCAFYACSNLTSITIPDSVTSISPYAFYACSNLTSIVIGSSVTIICRGAFYDSLPKVYYKGTESDWAKISIDSANLLNATRYYYSEAEPTSAGNYWHYDENNNIVVW